MKSPAFYEVYNALGTGFREVVYERALALRDRGLRAEQQVPDGVWFRGHRVGRFGADLVVAETMLLELKALPSLTPGHGAWMLNALRATRLGRKPEPRVGRARTAGPSYAGRSNPEH